MDITYIVRVFAHFEFLINAQTFVYILSIRNDRCRFGRCSTLSLHRGSSHGKSIVGQFHRPGKILLLSFPSSSSVEISFSFSLSPPISPFISRRSAYSYSPNALFANLPARIAEEDVNKQDRYFFAASEWEFMRAAREKEIVFYIFLDFLLSLDKLARSAGVRGRLAFLFNFKLSRLCFQML